MFKPGPRHGKSSAPSAFSLGLGLVLAAFLAATPALAQQERQLEAVDVQPMARTETAHELGSSGADELHDRRSCADRH
ncbi:MAG: hypothetical protein ACWGPN_06900 [Gammaproteobacteria bacterium]